VSNDPYAAPSANLNTESAPIKTSIWSAKGRLGVLSYLAQAFLFSIIAMAIFFAVIFIVGMVFGGGLEEMAAGGGEGMGPMIVGIVSIPLFLIMMYVSWCFIIKRLHDKNKSGWLSLIMLIPIVNIFMGIYWNILCFNAW